MQIQKLKPYELFKIQDTIKYHSKATSASVNNPLLLIKKELNELYNYIQVKFSKDPLKWDSSQQYHTLDIVSYNNNIYQALENNINSEPPNTSWKLIDTNKISLDSIYLSKNSSNFIGLYNYNSDSAMKIENDKNSFIRTTQKGLLPLTNNGSSLGDINNKFNGYFNNVNLSSLAPTSNNSVDIGTSSNIFRNIYCSSIKCDNIIPSTDTSNIGSSSNKFNSMYAKKIYGTSTSAEYADLAERYYSDEIYEPGTVLGVGGIKEVTLYQPGMKLAGVVSTSPAFKMNDNTNENHTLMPFIALKGKIPVKTSVNITKGQYVLASEVQPGECYGVNTLTFEMSLRLIGVALEDYYVNDIIKTVNVKI